MRKPICGLNLKTTASNEEHFESTHAKEASSKLENCPNLGEEWQVKEEESLPLADNSNSCPTKMHQLSDSEEEDRIENEEEKCKKYDEMHESVGKQENVQLVSNGNTVQQNVCRLSDNEEEEQVKNEDEICEKSNEIRGDDGSDGNVCPTSNVVCSQPKLQQSCDNEDKGFRHECETCEESGEVPEQEEVCEEKSHEEVIASEGSPVPSLPNTNESCSQNIVCRVLCSYGDKCYRKNVDHKKAYCHPWDPDYQTVFDSLPRCPYGVRCYRKNKAHWQTHVHPPAALPARPVKRVKKQTTAVMMQDSDSEDDDSADSFLNDASSDDYQPTNTDSDSDSISDEVNESNDEPDAKRMKKEAKRFLRKKK